MEDDNGTYSLELTLHLHPSYVLFCSSIHFSFFLHTSVGTDKEEKQTSHFLQFIQIHILDNC